mgnify:FL=1
MHDFIQFSKPAQVSIKNKQNIVIKMPGIFYKLVGDFMSEKLPLMIFTNRTSFKMSLAYQIEEYECFRQHALHQLGQVR